MRVEVGKGVRHRDIKAKNRLIFVENVIEEEFWETHRKSCFRLHRDYFTDPLAANVFFVHK